MSKTHSLAALTRLALLSVLMLGAALPASAQWKWRDPTGKLQFSDLPPPNGTPEKDILQRPANARRAPIVVQPYGQTTASEAPASAASAVRSAPSKEELARQAQEKQREKELQAQQKEEARRSAEQRRANCQSAQDNLRLLESGVRIRRVNAQGEPEVLDDKQREAELQRTRAAASSECR
ncbi:hypothetical protein HNP55_000414 [Paucibacter oligotrophus]|uniref:DUF4124 domain-containing protein n=1 Tax=Roseateles oligotrophus TaxID=1769250 RepID=A0A840L6Y0_9BURK|nr:DUF4124 domain-containing protein [Roseateles oligotrophus]MBB4841919.1 hypothetical protein [Roseateles oligotrophus]